MSLKPGSRVNSSPTAVGEGDGTTEAEEVLSDADLQVVFQLWCNRSGRERELTSRIPTQLSRVVFYDPEGQEIRARSVAQLPIGGNPPGEHPEQLLTPDTHEKWLTRIGDPFVLVFTLPEGVDPHQVAAYEFFTANDFPDRDPICWEVFLHYSGQTLKFDSQRLAVSTDERFVSMGKFPLNLITSSAVRFFFRADDNSHPSLQFFHHDRLVVPLTVECGGNFAPAEAKEEFLVPEGADHLLFFTFPEESPVTHYRVNSTGRAVWKVWWQDSIGMWAGMDAQRANQGSQLFPLRGVRPGDIPCEIRSPPELTTTEERWKQKLEGTYQQIETELGRESLQQIVEESWEGATFSGVEEGDALLQSRPHPPEILRNLQGRIYITRVTLQQTRQVKVRIGGLKILCSQPAAQHDETLSLSCCPTAITRANARYCQADDFFQAMRLMDMYEVTLHQFLVFLGGLLASEIPLRCIDALETKNPFSLLVSLPWPSHHKKSALK